MTLVLVVAIPLALALGIAIVGGRLGRRALGIVTAAAMALSFGAGVSMIATLRDRPSLDAVVASWLPIAGADFALVLDSSMLAVALAITGVSALIAVYSITYLAHDRGLQRYFASVTLLVAGTLLVALASNLILLIVGWQLAGVAAYLLVGHHRDDLPAARAAHTLFLVQRLGDAALIAGTLLLVSEFHTVDLAQLGGVAIEHGSAAGGLLGAASVLLLVAAIARSAQVPLHGWLPGSAEAAAPVSALIQTVAVTGGVILVMRLRSILVPDVLSVTAVVGGVTALGAGVVAIAQRDVRRVLAWSTISQVGLMFVAAGLGALFAARFHLIAHALLKAVLVLGAGSVRRATGDESDLARYGGLARRMRWTAGAFAVGTLALAGIPPAAGFFGIAAVVSAAFSESEPLLTALVLLTAAASAFAGVRLFVLIFIAPAAGPRAHEVRASLQDVPLAVLALGALGFGAIVSAGVVPIGTGPADEAPLTLVAATFAIVVTAAVAAWIAYRNGLAPAARIERALGWARGGLVADSLYARAVARPFAVLVRRLDSAEQVNDRLVAAVASLAVRTSAVMQRAHPGSAQAQQTLLLAGAVTLLALWTWSAR